MTLNEYLDSQGRGSAAALAKAIGASKSGVCLWRSGVRQVPVVRPRLTLTRPPRRNWLTGWSAPRGCPRLAAP